MKDAPAFTNCVQGIVAGLPVVSQLWVERSVELKALQDPLMFQVTSEKFSELVICRGRFAHKN